MVFPRSNGYESVLIETKAHTRLASGDLDPIVKEQKVYTAFSGGGWHAYTTHAALLMGALDGMSNDGAKRSLEALTQHVVGMAANSGGSWFLSMLAFAEAFKSQVETFSIDEYCANGWLGKQRDIFNNDYDNGHGGTDTSKMLANWVDSTQNSVFKPLGLYETLNSIKLSGTHLPWAQEKSVVFATSLGTGRVLDGLGIMSEPGVILSKNDGKKNTYTYTAYDSGIYPQVAATPVLLTSLGDSGQKMSAPFMAGDFTLAYSDGSSTAERFYHANVSPGNLSVFDAATCSSQYRVYDVTTKENATLGIKAGSKGELHVFTNYMPDATPMPGQTGGPDIEKTFDMYDAMLKTVRGGFGGDRWNDLKSALNLIK